MAAIPIDLAFKLAELLVVKTAVVHDGTIHPGGAVRVVTEAAGALDADLFVGFSGKNHQWWEDHVTNDVTILRTTSRNGTINNLRTARSMLNLNLRGYDIVLTSGPASKFFQPYDDQLQIHFLHHPPLPSLWYTGGLFDYFVKSVDRVETQSIPHIIANSELTALRAHRQYNIDVDRVITPPVNVEDFTVSSMQKPNQLVMVGRLETRKRPELAIEAMRELPDFSLKIIGDGPLRSELERSAPSNVQFSGYVSNGTLRDTIESSMAGIFLADHEDFGITPIEYMAAGIPVVGVDEPNTNNQIDEETGVLVKPSPDAVADGIREASQKSWNRDRIREVASTYGADRFRREIREFVQSVTF